MKAIYSFLILLISYDSFSQAELNGFSVQMDKRTRYTETEEKTNFTPAFINNIPGVVMIEFTKRYPEVTVVDWYISDKQVDGYFSCGEKNISIAYKKDGLFLYERRSYPGSYLDSKALDFLEKESGFSQPVKHVTEVIKTNETLYEVSIEDQKYWHIYTFGMQKGEDLKLIGKTRFKKG
jgi:hypothetical protein